MKNKERSGGKRIACFVLIGISVAILLLLEVLSPVYSDDKVLDSMISMIVSRAIGGLVFIVVSAYLGFDFFDPLARPFFRSLLFILPCLAVAINNFPIISAIRGDAYLVSPKWYIPVLAVECLMIGIFEEFAFRGVVFMSILEKRHRTNLDIFISIVLTSAVFGAVHLLNVFQGAGIGSVILQIGYSFLIGGMCSVVLIKTKNIWFCVIIHAVYDFGGYFMQTLGAGTWWDTPTVIITVILSVLVAIYVIIALIRLEPGSVDGMFSASGSFVSDDK